MIMPYSTKPTGAPAPQRSAPDKINFDRLWEAAFAPQSTTRATTPSVPMKTSAHSSLPR